MGFDQGRAFRDLLRARLGRPELKRRHSFTLLHPLLLHPLASGPVLGRAPAREIIRHYAHGCERMSGVAEGAGVPLASLMELFLSGAEQGGESFWDESVTLAARRAADGTALTLARSLEPEVAPDAVWVARRSCPDVGFSSLEVTLPWSVTSVAGLNQAGLSAALAPLPRSEFASSSAQATPALLVQDCLQRFAQVDAALDWCMKRPVSGRACIVLADASGASGAVEIQGARRQVKRARDGLLLAGVGADFEARVRKRFQESPGLDPGALFDRGGGAPSGGAGWVRADPHARQLALCRQYGSHREDPPELFSL